MVMALTIAGCAAGPRERTAVLTIDRASGVVLDRFHQDVIITLNPFHTEGDDLISIIASDIMAASALLSGKETQIGLDRFLITGLENERLYLHGLYELRGYYGRDHQVELSLPKKSLVVVDFEVPAGNHPYASPRFQDLVMAQLKQAGHYAIVEPAQVAAALGGKNHKGGFFLDRPRALELGKKVGADLLLTATVSRDLAGEWFTHIRLFQINQENLLLAQTYPKDRKVAVAETRTTSAVMGDFGQGAAAQGWELGKFQDTYVGLGGQYEVFLQEGAGVGDNKRCLSMRFALGERQEDQGFPQARIINKKSRNLSAFKGMEFYARADQPLILWSYLVAGEPEIKSLYFNTFPLTKEWKKYTLNFSEPLASGVAYAHPNPLLKSVWSIRFGISKEWNQAEEGQIWIDQVRFF